MSPQWKSTPDINFIQIPCKKKLPLISSPPYSSYRNDAKLILKLETKEKFSGKMTMHFSMAGKRPLLMNKSYLTNWLLKVNRNLEQSTLSVNRG